MIEKKVKVRKCEENVECRECREDCVHVKKLGNELYHHGQSE